MKLTKMCIMLLAVVAVGAAQAAPKNFNARLHPDNEVPPVESEARGKASVRFNKEYTMARFAVTVRGGMGLLGSGGAHLHCAPAGENGPVIATLAGAVPGGLESWLSIRAGITDANINETACGTTLAEVAEAMFAGEVYANVHSEAFPGGEVRGQFGKKAKEDDEDDEG